MKRLAIFAHYDGHGEVKRYVLHHLSALRSVASAVWFVSSADLSEAELDKARHSCERAWTRENTGYDFSMWKDALARTALTEWDEVLVTNSSVLGPLLPLDEVLAKMDAVPVDYWGMTDNYRERRYRSDRKTMPPPETTRHLQSYFLVFRRALVHSPAFEKFWNGVVPLREKGKVIDDYEIGLTRTFGDAGFHSSALVASATLPRSPLWIRARRPEFANPTILHPTELVRRGMPYVKLELFRRNPARVNLRALVREVERAGYDPSLIEVDR